MSMAFLSPKKLIGDFTGANQAAKGAEEAANAQVQSAQEANALLKYIYDTNREDLSPYRQHGREAIDMMASLNGMGGKPVDYSSFTNSPGYQFALNQGQQGIQRQLAASGLGASGRAIKAANNYAQDYAGQGFGQFYNRLAGMAGSGQQAIDSGGQMGMNYASNAGQNLLGAGNARASSYIARGNVGVNNFNNLMKIAGTAAGAMSGGMGGGGFGRMGDA